MGRRKSKKNRHRKHSTHSSKQQRQQHQAAQGNPDAAASNSQITCYLSPMPPEQQRQLLASTPPGYKAFLFHPVEQIPLKNKRDTIRALENILNGSLQVADFGSDCWNLSLKIIRRGWTDEPDAESLIRKLILDNWRFLALCFKSIKRCLLLQYISCCGSPYTPSGIVCTYSI